MNEMMGMPMQTPFRGGTTRSLGLLAATLLLAACGGPPPAPAPAPMPGGGAAELYDYVIENGRIVDGTGAAWYYGDLAVRDDRIARITPAGLLADAPARERIDATGHVVGPGFIDIQSHSRYAFLDGDGRIVSKVTQGITTEIMGESTTNAPLNPANLPEIEDEDTRTRAQRYSGAHAFDAWLRDMEAHGASANLGSFVGATTIRVYAKETSMGGSTAAELDTMRAAVRRAMEDGAFGLASALIYPPGNFASTEELGAVSEAMAPYGGLYITHMRSEADLFLEAIDEAIEIGRLGGVPVEIYHLKAGGQRNWHKTELAIARIDSARAAGVDVQANMYPYTAGGTGLTACFPPWASADGALMDNLADPGMRQRIRGEIENQTTDWENLCALAGPERVLLLGFNRDENRQYIGKYLSEVSQMAGTDWIDTAMDLVLSERQRIGTIYFLMSEENVQRQLRAEWIKFGTDAGGIDPERATGLTHPRAYGTFPRILGRYVREEGVISLEDAVRKMSSAVATRLSIRERGLLREGFFADIVVFDPETVIDRATYEEPHQLSVGIRDVLVNGVPVVRGGAHTNATPGRIVRGPGWTGWGGGG